MAMSQTLSLGMEYSLAMRDYSLRCFLKNGNSGCGHSYRT